MRPSNSPTLFNAAELPIEYPKKASFRATTNGQLLPHIAHAYIKRVFILHNAPPTFIKAASGIKYECVYESCHFLWTGGLTDSTECIISFQGWKDGRAFCVIRPHKPLQADTKEQTNV